jgi:DNA-binding response OmpR family regulator
MTPSQAPARFGVLVVEDEPLILDFVTTSIRALGFAAHGARGGREAERLLREKPGEIDAALIDLQMPGLDGGATCRVLREVKPELRCCLMSGLGHGATSLPDGFCCVLGKPFTLPELRTCLALLRERVEAGAALSARPCA